MSAQESKPRRATPLELFNGGWVDGRVDALSGREYYVYEFYPEHVERIKAALGVKAQEGQA